MASKLPKAKSEPEERFALTWRTLGGPSYEREYQFHPTRKWKFDFCWPNASIAVEIEGGAWEGEHRGRHLRQLGFTDDCVKYAEGALLGWRVIRLTPPMIQPALLERIILAVRRASP
jgi:very-short-patch-repair endonuclease